MGQISVTFPPAERDYLRELAAKEKITVAELIRRALHVHTQGRISRDRFQGRPLGPSRKTLMRKMR